MMRVAISRGSRETRNQHIGTECSDNPHQVADCYIVPAPLLERLLRRLRESEVSDTSEALLYTVIFVSSKEFQGTEHTEFIGEGISRLVLSTLPAREGTQK